MGLLSLHHAHKEQREEREMDKSWGPRVLVGIYVGCIMNHKVNNGKSKKSWRLFPFQRRHAGKTCLLLNRKRVLLSVLFILLT